MFTWLRNLFPSQASVPEPAAVDYGPQVRDGISWLDRNIPGWKLDRQRLNIGVETQCVLGQTCGTYTAGRKKFSLTAIDAVAYGFAVGSNPCYYQDLTEEWQKQLAARDAMAV